MRDGNTEQVGVGEEIREPGEKLTGVIIDVVQSYSRRDFPFQVSEQSQVLRHIKDSLRIAATSFRKLHVGFD